MKDLTEKQIENMAAVVVALFSDSIDLEIGTINEMFFAYVNVEKLIEDGTEEWPAQLIDNYNGGGYKTTQSGAKAIYDDLWNEYHYRKDEMRFQD